METKFLSEQDYRAFDAHNFSTLKYIVPPSTPYHYWMQKNYPVKATKAMIEGTLTHTAVLEPKRFAREYVLYKNPFPSMTSAKAKAAFAEFQTLHPNKEIITDEKLLKSLLRRQKNCYRNMTIAAILQHENAIVEDSMTWIDTDTGVQMKCKVDLFIKRHGGIAADVKTFRAITDKALSWEIAEMLYFMQAAIYIDGIRAVYGIDIDEYFIIAIDKGNDLVRLIPLSNLDIEIGRKLYHQAIIKAEDCSLMDSYPGYEDILLPLELNPRLMRGFEELDF